MSIYDAFNLNGSREEIFEWFKSCACHYSIFPPEKDEDENESEEPTFTTYEEAVKAIQEDRKHSYGNQSEPEKLFKLWMVEMLLAHEDGWNYIDGSISSLD